MPDNLESFLQFNADYEEEHFLYSDENHALAVATRENLLSHFLPESLYLYGAPLFHAFLDSPLLNACGLPPASPKLRWMLERAMRLRSHASSLRPETTKHRTEVPIRSYPEGYVIERVGGQYQQERPMGEQE